MGSGAPYSGCQLVIRSAVRIESTATRVRRGRNGPIGREQLLFEFRAHEPSRGHLRACCPTCVAAAKGAIDCARFARTLMESFAAELGR